MRFWRQNFRFLNNSRRVYLDHASAPPPDPRVYAAMHSVENIFANPGASHREGREAREKLDEARSHVGRLLGVKKDEIIFTSGGTEANNLAIIGLVRGLEKKGHPLSSVHLVTSPIEHPSVLECFEELRNQGVAVSYISIGTDGLVSKEALESVIKKNTVLVSLAYVNSEIGVVQPIRALFHSVRKRKQELGGLSVFMHTDASQAPMYFDITPHTLGADLMTIDALKMRGPKGSGVLFARFMTPLSPVLLGGGQEKGLRPGTEDVVRAQGLSLALDFAISGRRMRAKAVRDVRDYALERILKEVPGTVLNGHKKERSPNNINISISGVDGEYAAVILDTLGVACSTRSACLGTDGSGSDVIRALYPMGDRATSALRFTLGEETTRMDIDTLVIALKRAAVEARIS